MKVSVVIPNYNHARFLPTRIETVLNQTFQDFDVLILDDASPDHSREVIARYVGGRVRFEGNERNSGSTFAQWGKAFERTRGEYVWIAESDDEADPRFLERAVAVLDSHPDVSFVYCQASLIDENGKVFGLALPVRWAHGAETAYARDFVRPGLEELRISVQFQSSPVPNASSVLFRRASVVAAGGPDPSYRLCGDLDLYGRLLRKGSVAYLAEPLNRYRHHRGTVRVRTERDGTGVVERYRFVKELWASVTLSEAQESEAFERLADRWVNVLIRWDGRPALGTQGRILEAARAADPRWLRRFGGALFRCLRGAIARRRELPKVSAG